MSDDLGRMLTEAAEAARRGDPEPGNQFRQALHDRFPASGERIPTTCVDYEIDKAIRGCETGRLLNIYSAAGCCTTKEFGVIEEFVNWIHNLKVRGYGMPPAPATDDSC